MAEHLLAARRDASWCNYPGVARRYHLLDPVHETRPLCGLSAVLDCVAAVNAESVSLPERCQRNGCRARWPRKMVRRG